MGIAWVPRRRVTMNDVDLLLRLKDSEDNFVERKSQGVSTREIRQTASAFANTLDSGENAVLFIGVEDDGAPIGVDNTDVLQKRVDRACDANCYPSIKYTSHVLEDEGKMFVAIVFSASDNKPHFTGAAYVRRGSKSVNANDEMYATMIAGQNEKCGRIQAFGGQTVTVITHKKLGSSKYVADQAYRARHDCTVVEVDAHTLRLFDIGLRQRFAEPMRNVEVSYDEERYRPMLIIRQFK